MDRKGIKSDIINTPTKKIYLLLKMNKKAVENVSADFVVFLSTFNLNSTGSTAKNV